MLDWTIHCSACKQNKTVKKQRKPEESDAFSKTKHRHGDSVANPQCASVNKLILYITMHEPKAPIYKLFAAHHQNIKSSGWQTYEKN